jgi:predicted nucleic acid-binding protein
MTFAVDASVVGKLFFVEERSDLALALFSDAARAQESVIAPSLLPSEFVNIVRRKMRREGVSLQRATAVVDEFLALPIQYRADSDIYRQAIIHTERYSLSGFDAQYVALGELAGCDLWVDDERLLTALGGRLSFVKWLGDYGLRGTGDHPV